MSLIYDSVKSYKITSVYLLCYTGLMQPYVTNIIFIHNLINSVELNPVWFGRL